MKKIFKIFLGFIFLTSILLAVVFVYKNFQLWQELSKQQSKLDLLEKEKIQLNEKKITLEYEKNYFQKELSWSRFFTNPYDDSYTSYEWGLKLNLPNQWWYCNLENLSYSSHNDISHPNKGEATFNCQFSCTSGYLIPKADYEACMNFVKTKLQFNRFNLITTEYKGNTPELENKQFSTRTNKAYSVSKKKLDKYIYELTFLFYSPNLLKAQSTPSEEIFGKYKLILPFSEIKEGQETEAVKAREFGEEIIDNIEFINLVEN